MSGIDDLLAGNQRFAATFSGGNLPISPGKGTVVVTCVDARVDPAQIFDVDLGDIFVLRSVGGRVTPDIQAQLGMLRALMSSVPGAEPPAVVVMHHTQCGTAKFADPELKAKAAEMAGVDEAVIDRVVVTDAHDSVATDVAAVCAVVPEGTVVRGFVYDIATGVASPV